VNNANDSPGLYIHIPFCQKKCAYCAFYSEPVDKYNTEKFVEALKKEILRIDDKSVNTVYVGGGSPSALPVELLGELLALVSSEFPNIEEFTVEINPAQTTLKLLETLADNKVTRLSTGVQSFSRRQLNRLGRIHSPAGAQKAVKNAQAMGFDNINIDLIFAIPGSNIVSVNNNIQKAIELDVQHISAYSLSLEPLTAITRDVNAGKLKAVSNQLDARMYESIIRKLTNCGFLHYEISNFAKQNHQCLHNLKYWSNETFYAAGPGAHSFVNNIRAENVSDIKQYISLIDAGKKPVSRSHALSWEEYACQTAVLNLRKTKGLNLSQYQKKVGKDVRELFAGAVEKLTNQGLLQLSQDYLCLAETALPAADTVMREFAIIEKDY
jgi:oxygen-independent coproporphyrinogen-3 oxidase